MKEKFVLRDNAGDLDTSREFEHFQNSRHAYFKESKDAIEPALGVLDEIEADKQMNEENPVTDDMSEDVLKACELDPLLFKNFFSDK